MARLGICPWSQRGWLHRPLPDARVRSASQVIDQHLFHNLSDEMQKLML